MSAVSEAFGAALGVVFVAELGDKSQLLTLAFTTRYRWPVVLAGVSIATAVLMAVSVTVGGLAGAIIPRRTVEVIAGVVFLGFAAWTVWDRGGEQQQAKGEELSTIRALPAIVGAFCLAELGDKTMLATVALASTRDLFGTWAGATAGMVAANGLAVLIGDRVSTLVPRRLLEWAAAALFTLFGILLLVGVGGV